jgi:hypothetical protein
MPNFKVGDLVKYVNDPESFFTNKCNKLGFIFKINSIGGHVRGILIKSNIKNQKSFHIETYGPIEIGKEFVLGRQEIELVEPIKIKLKLKDLV